MEVCMDDDGSVEEQESVWIHMFVASDKEREISPVFMLLWQYQDGEFYKLLFHT
ncbi:hypothetical protein JOB18_041656 [Solea senegalensis]|uniref:Uncharacterized protein n=1 Tax=Solea senegalensis TaxID=28829 RepID=A0AAV6RK03_SOLSE|nr:hypothetical protein JOB18_041656 [Solea senegalensis]